MNKPDLIRTVALLAEMPQREVARVIEHLHSAVVSGLLEDGEVILPNIGKLVVKPRPVRKIKDISTGELVNIPPGKRVQYRPSQYIKEVAELSSEYKS